MALINNLNKLLNKISQAGIPLRYKDESYVEEDVLLDYLLDSMQHIEDWELNKQGYSAYNTITRKDHTRDIRVLQNTRSSYGNMFEIESYQNDVKEFKVTIYKSFSNRRKFKKLIKLFNIIEGYYLELEEGKNRNKIITSLKKF